MSIEAINWALDLNLRPTEKLVVIVLANYADSQGVCWPSFETLSKKTCLCRRAVIQQIANLEKIGVIKRIDKQYRQQNVYHLNLSTSEYNALVTSAPDAPVETTSAPHALELVHHMHLTSAPDAPKPSYNHHLTTNLLSTDESVDVIHPVELSQQNFSPPLQLKNQELKNQVQEVISFLNEKTGRAYGMGKSNFRLIAARLKEGATVTQCKQIIVRKARKWLGDTKMDEYLRPKTLFNQTNFEQYLGELVLPKEEESCN